MRDRQTAAARYEQGMPPASTSSKAVDDARRRGVRSAKQKAESTIENREALRRLVESFEAIARKLNEEDEDVARGRRAVTVITRTIDELEEENEKLDEDLQANPKWMRIARASLVYVTVGLGLVGLVIVMFRTLQASTATSWIEVASNVGPTITTIAVIALCFRIAERTTMPIDDRTSLEHACARTPSSPQSRGDGETIPTALAGALKAWAGSKGGSV